MFLSLAENSINKNYKNKMMNLEQKNKNQKNNL